MNLAIIGSRTFNDYEKFKEIIFLHVNLRNVNVIVSGGANGADKMAERFADEFNIAKIIFPVTSEDYNQHGKKAYYFRNKKIVQNSHCAIAFWDGQSKGTEMTIKMFKDDNNAWFII